MPLATAQSLGWNLSRTLMTVIVIIKTSQGYPQRQSAMLLRSLQVLA
jgi:hypothetical protein